MPNTVERTGSEVLPLPRERARLIPATAGTEAPARAKVVTAVALGIVDCLARPATARLAVVARHAGNALTNATATSMPAIAVAIIGPSTYSPGDGSATRAIPSGVSGDSATATMTAMPADIVPITSVRPIATIHCSRGVIPSAPRVSLSSEETAICRVKV
jgi:hypothetical protein